MNGAITAWWHPVTEPEICCHTDASAHCTRPAVHVLLLMAAGKIAGTLPLCEECAKTMATQFETKRQEGEVEVEPD